MNSMAFFPPKYSYFTKNKVEKAFCSFFPISMCGYLERKYFFQSSAAKIATLLRSAPEQAGSGGEGLC